MIDRFVSRWKCPILAGIVVLSLFSAPSIAAIKLGTGLSDDMVVQRDQEFILWGDATAGQQVDVSIGSQQLSGKTDEKGHWQVTVPPLALGTTYTAVIKCGADSVTLKNIVSGDVWLCSGQSNMQFGVGDDINGPALLKEADHLPMIRLLSVPKGGSDTVQKHADAHWVLCSSRNVEHFANVGFQMGRLLSMDPALKDVPIGLIDSSFGGTAAEEWIPAAKLSDFKPAELQSGMFGIKPAALFNSMIAPLGEMRLKGVVWYQGESNAGRPELYTQLLTDLITEWRTLFHQPELPFVIVQLPSLQTNGGLPFTWVREAELKVTKSVPKTALAVTFDTCDGSDLHPRDKGEVARRVALQARHLAYGENIVSQGPQFAGVKVEGATLRILFDTAGSPLRAKNPNAVRGFAVAGNDGVYRYADAVIDGDSIVAHCSEIPSPATVRYAWGATPDADLQNRDGLPAGPFRTDDAPIAPTPELQQLPQDRHLATSTYEITISAYGMPTSIGVFGQQLLSNDLGMSGGCKVPSFFGPLFLNAATELAPDVIRYDGANMLATYQFGQDQMTWVIENHNRDRRDFVINLSPQVRLIQKSAAPDGVVELQRGEANVKITGVDAGLDRQENSAIGIRLEGGKSRTVTFTFSKKKAGG